MDSDRLRNLTDSGKYFAALKEIEILEADPRCGNRYDSQDGLIRLLLKCRILVELEFREEALECLKLVMERATKLGSPKGLVIEALLMQANALRGLAKLDESKGVLEDVDVMLQEDTAEIAPEDARRLQLLSALASARVERLRGHLDKALRNLAQLLPAFEDLGEIPLIITTMTELGRVYHLQGDLANGMEYLLKALGMAKELGSEAQSVQIANSIGIVYYQKGEPHAALQHFQECLAAASNADHRIWKSQFLLNCGAAYARLGEFEHAMEYYKRSLAMSRESPFEEASAIPLANIGLVHRERGELGLANDYFEKSLVLFERSGQLLRESTVLGYIAELKRARGDLQAARQGFEKRLNVVNQLGDRIGAADTLCNLVRVAIEMNDRTTAKGHLDELTSIDEALDNKHVHSQCQYATALYLKSSDRFTHKARAQLILQSVSETEDTCYRLVADSMLSHADLLLEELRSSSDPEIINELKHLIDTIQKTATSQYSFWLLAETYLLESHVALLEFDIKKARSLMNEAQIIAQEKGLQLLARRASRFHDELLAKSALWDEMIEKNAPLLERLDAADLDKLVSGMLKRMVTTPSDKTEIPIMLLVVGAVSGVAYFAKTFMPEEGRQANDQMVAGFLSAINSVIGFVFSTEGSIERIQHQEYTMLTKPMGSLRLWYIFRGESYCAMQRLERFSAALMTQQSLWEIISSVGEQSLHAEHMFELDRLAEIAFTQPVDPY